MHCIAKLKKHLVLLLSVRLDNMCILAMEITTAILSSVTDNNNTKCFFNFLTILHSLDWGKLSKTSFILLLIYHLMTNDKIIEVVCKIMISALAKK